MSKQAFDDLVWMSRRLSGIVSLQDEFSDYSKFKDQSTEMENSIGKMQSELLDLQSKKLVAQEEVDAVLDRAREQEKKAVEEATDIVVQAKEQAKKLVAVATAKAVSKQEEADGKVQAVVSQEESAKVRLSEVQKALDVAETKFAQIKQELDALKSKI